MNRNYPRNPAFQPVKGIIVFHAIDEINTKAEALLKSLCCEVIATHENRFTVKSSRGNLQSIKKRWQNLNPETEAGLELQSSVSQIIIGGTI